MKPTYKIFILHTDEKPHDEYQSMYWQRTCAASEQVQGKGRDHPLEKDASEKKDNNETNVCSTPFQRRNR